LLQRLSAGSLDLCAYTKSIRCCFMCVYTQVHKLSYQYDILVERRSSACRLAPVICVHTQSQYIIASCVYIFLVPSLPRTSWRVEPLSRSSTLCENRVLSESLCCTRVLLVDMRGAAVGSLELCVRTEFYEYCAHCTTSQGESGSFWRVEPLSRSRVLCVRTEF
jgi:hypothetical protein